MEISVLSAAKNDYKSDLRCFLEDRKLNEHELVEFFDDKSFESAETALKKKDCNERLMFIRAINGASGNTDMLGLYRRSGYLVRLLRNGNYSEENDVKYFDNIEKAYVLTKEAIKKLRRHKNVGE